MNRSRLFAILAGVIVVAALWFIFVATGGPKVIQEGDLVSEDAAEEGTAAPTAAQPGEED